MHRNPDDAIFESLRSQLDGPEMKRATRLGCFLTGIILVGVLSLALISPYVNFLWYVHDVRTPQVFQTAYGARGTLLALAFFPTWALLYFSVRKALGQTLVYLKRPESMETALASHAAVFIQERGAALLRLAAPLIAFFMALGFANEWSTMLVARNAQPFGMKDPTYGMDLGFFVFTLPWYRALANYAFGALLITTLATGAVYFGIQSLATLARAELAKPQIRAHLSILVGVTVLLLAGQTWLKTYEIGLMESTQFTGAGYAGIQQLGATRIFAVLLALIGLGSLINARAGQPYAVPIGGGVLAGLFYLVGVVVYPSLVQRWGVTPQLITRESRFASQAIQMTRFGYGLDQIEERNFETTEVPTAAQVRESQATLDNMRLWDPEILRLSLESQQALRRYYRFDDVDIDRYPIGGQQTMVMLAPRDIDPGGLGAAAQNWVNRRLRYTHGYGVVMARVNGATADGQPLYLMRDIPMRTTANLEVEQPRIYFSDRRGSFGRIADEYAIVNTREPEVSYQTTTGETVTHRWTGGRGIPTSGLLSRLALSVALGDMSLMIASNLTSESRLLMRRNVVERARMVLPFLAFDMDPYIVVHQGRLLWMLDGYTTTDMIPYSQMTRGGNGKLNYIRNSVKATVDAYTGEVRAYAVMPDQPILKAYRGVYPGLVRDLSELPKGLEQHFRYPEDLLTLQSNQLTAYHVDDPAVFLGELDAWEVGFQRGLTGGKEPMRPYYVQMQLPDEPKKGFVQILPFTARGKPNMSGWLAAHCDPGDYGRVTLYRFTSEAPPPGPELMESSFLSNPEVSNINRTFNNEQSEIIVGNLLVVPIGDSVMYVEPLFLRSRTQGLQAPPRLFRVILALKDRVVVRETYAEALRALFDGAGTPTQAPSEAPQGTARPSDRPDVRRALELLNQAEQAQRSGDWARYGELQRQLRRQLEELAGGSGASNP